jgi:arylsulfatase A-like enzyme
MFIYLEGVDRAGHTYGWMSGAYMEALHQADTAVGIIWEALAATGLEKGTVLIVHSDHGGSGNHHQEPIPENQTIPWMARGPGIRRGHRISAPVSVLDTAPTIAGIMNIPCHYNWKGRSLREIFLGNGDRPPNPKPPSAVMT